MPCCFCILHHIHVLTREPASFGRLLLFHPLSYLSPLVCLRHVEGLPVATLGNTTVDGLRRLLGTLGAKPGGPRHIVLTDLREELVL